MSYQYLKVPGRDRLILHIDYAMEKERADLFRPLLAKFGQVYNHLTPDTFYPRMDPVTRCFDAAMMLALAYPELRYVEGLMVIIPNEGRSGVIPIGHGWCITEDNRVVDPTGWKHYGDPIFHYWGVPIKVDYSRAWKHHTGYYGCLDGYPDGQLGEIYTDPPERWLDHVTDEQPALL